MGKIIVKNIKGMGWKTRIGLIAMLTLVFSVFIYQGFQQTRDAQAAVALGTAWSNIHAAAPATSLPAGTNVNTTSTGTFTAGAGNNRLLLVAVYYELGTASTATFTTTFGGAAVTQIASSGGTSNREHVWLGYVKNASIPAAASTVVSGINCATASTLTSISIKVATYTGVDQATPITGSNANIAAAATVASNAAVSYVTNGMTVVAHANGGAPATVTTMGGTPALAVNSTASNTTNHSTYIYESAVHTSSSTYASGNITVTYGGTTSTRSAIAIAALKPATIVGNGVAGTTQNVAPGATGQKLDGFSFVATTTDTINTLTVTTTGQAAIASMQIWNEAGTTQYFTTVNNPGSNTWAFSGGTAIPVTSTVANYKVVVTYRSRALAPAGNTATSASVTAFTTANGNTLAGSDTADTTLTLLNTHAASTWGANSAAESAVTLNWTYGTPGQSVIIIRYAGANTDTTKPVDGTAYIQGNPFGTGGTVAYVGGAATFTDQPLTNGVTYYYKIFEKDTFNYYYNATDIWTAGLTPISNDLVAPTVDAGFTATTPVNTLNIPITSFAATDNVGGSGISGYLITTSSAQPSSGAAGWTATPPATFAVAADGSYTLYPWTKDGANNVSPLYGSPVTVLVDRVAPAVATFTAGPSPIASKTIPVTDFTGTDDSSGVSGYMITTSTTPPTAGAAGWTATAPATYTVATDGEWNLYPWVKDAAGNVSAVPVAQSVQVDTTAPTGLTLTSPADNALDLPTAVTMQVSPATDPAGGVGGVLYLFSIRNNDNTWSQTSGWQSGTSFSMVLTQGVTYVWKVQVKDSLENTSVWSTPRSFTIQAPCVRNAPTLTLLSGTGGTSAKITADGGTVPYTLTLINNDVGSCGSTTFNLSVTDYNDVYGAFITPSTLSSTSATLNPGAQTTKTLTVQSKVDTITGSMRTTVTSAADAYHTSITSQYVQTSLNVVGCTPRKPLLVVGPDSGYVAKGGTMGYTVTVKNTDSGTGCSPVTYNLTLSDSNSVEFNPSTYSANSIALNAGELGSVTLTVSAKASSPNNKINKTTLSLSSDVNHSNPLPKEVTSTVNNPMLHNSDNLASSRWGGWGLPGKKYGEIGCTTCHVTGDMSTKNIKRVRETIATPDGSLGNFPGNNQPIAFNRYSGKSSARGVFGWDGTATPRTSSTKICEVCHTYDSKRNNGVSAHPYSSYSAGVAKTLSNHFGTDGTDCIKCHKHNKGFGVGGGACIACHGDDTATTLTPATDYLVAPPRNYAGSQGTIRKALSQVNSDPKIGAHQTHLRFFNGFSNFSTVDGRCSYCHGPLPTNYNHINGSSSPAFQKLAVAGGMSPTFTAANVTCSNTYCHNPAGSTILKNAANTGSKVFPSWTTASYVTDATKSVANCSVCHKVPGVVGFQPAGTHTGMNTDTQDCSGCHGHNGDTGGKVGQRHMDGILFGAGNCNSCHSYDTTDVGAWLFGVTNFGGKNEGIGAHTKHINYIKARWGITLSASTDKFGLGAPAALCGMCHTNLDANHSMGDSAQPRTINFGDGSVARKYGASNPIYNGSFNTSSGTNPKTCANIDCHYKQTPVWSTY